MSLDLETLQVLWFVLWCVIWIAYFTFDSFTIGIGMLFPFVEKDRLDRNQLQEVVGPFWNGAEVWLVTAGGATFAAFPPVYADMFSLLYVPFFLVLFCLIFRATGLELMHKDENKYWVAFFKWAFIVSSYLISFLFGVLFSNLYLGLQMTPSELHSGLFELFSMYAIFGGLLFVSFFMTSGVAWIHIKANGPIVDRAFNTGKGVVMAMVALIGIYYVATANSTPILENFNDHPFLYLVPTLSLITAILAAITYFKRKMALTFAMVISTIALFFSTGFIGMFPNMLPSSIDDQFSLTLYNSSSSEKTLQIMLIVAIIFVPIVLAYQIWVHFLFRKKVEKNSAKGY